MTVRKATHARLATVLEAIPNVGASIARDLRSIGIKQPQELIGRNPRSLYQPCAIEPTPGRTLAFSTPSSPPFASWKEPPRVRGGPTPRSEKEIFRIFLGVPAGLPRPAG
jgi:hypothetical protein